jgi:hypothetical protein
MYKSQNYDQQQSNGDPWVQSSKNLLNKTNPTGQGSTRNTQNGKKIIIGKKNRISKGGGSTQGVRTQEAYQLMDDSEDAPTKKTFWIENELDFVPFVFERDGLGRLNKKKKRQSSRCSGFQARNSEMEKHKNLITQMTMKRHAKRGKPDTSFGLPRGPSLTRAQT